MFNNWQVNEIFFPLKSTALWSLSSILNVMSDRTVLFFFLKSLVLGPLYILYLGGLSNAKLNKIDSLQPFTILPLMQSPFEWTLPTPVILVGFSFLYVPGSNWTNPSISPNGPAWDCVNTKIVQKKISWYTLLFYLWLIWSQTNIIYGNVYFYIIWK